MNILSGKATSVQMETVRRVRQRVRMTIEELLESLRAMPEINRRLDGIARQVAAIQDRLSRLPAKQDENRWVDATGAARYMYVSKSTFDKYRYLTTPKLKGSRVGGKILFKKSDIDLFVRLYDLKKQGYA